MKWLTFSERAALDRDRDCGFSGMDGKIGALYPALRAARQDAVDALSYE